MARYFRNTETGAITIVQDDDDATRQTLQAAMTTSEDLSKGSHKHLYEETSEAWVTQHGGTASAPSAGSDVDLTGLLPLDGSRAMTGALLFGTNISLAPVPTDFWGDESAFLNLSSAPGLNAGLILNDYAGESGFGALYDDDSFDIRPSDTSYAQLRVRMGLFEMSGASASVHEQIAFGHGTASAALRRYDADLLESTSAHSTGSGFVAHSPDGTAYKLMPPNGGGAASWVAA